MNGQVEATPRIDSFAGERHDIQTACKPNGFGGCQTFFLCPVCGRRVRYLYQTGEGFRCRKCARLNYRSQQRPRSDSLYYYRKGMDYANKHLRPQFYPITLSQFSEWVPPPPRYMHQEAYRRRIARLRHYQEKHEAQQLEAVRRLVVHAWGAEVWEKIAQEQF